MTTSHSPGDRPHVSRIRFEHHDEPFGIGEAEPRLSWQIDGTAKDWWPAGYELRLFDDQGNEFATTGMVHSDQQILVPWPFPPLTSRQRAGVQVRATATDGRVTYWSETARVEVGLLEPTDWQAEAITSDPADQHGDELETPAPLLRHEFEVRENLSRARLYVTGHGLYEMTINGRVVGDHVLAPGWTSYDHRLRYQTHDVTGLIEVGANTLGALLGNGWYRGHLGFKGGRAVYGTRRALLAQLELTYADGHIERVVTDRSWRTAASHILSDDLYHGQDTDLRRTCHGWDTPGYDDRGWGAVEVVERAPSTLVAPDGPPVRRTGTVPAVSLTSAPDGRLLVDFGQNLVGWVRLTVRGHAGHEIVVRHAEVLEDGQLSVRPLRTAAATDRYVLADDSKVTLEPTLTFHGFRYAEVSGVPDLDVEDLEAVVVGSDLRRTGWFTCSDPDLERLHENIVWSMRGNFLDVPTDCPQRDERLGWTGDLQVFAPTATFLFDCAGFIRSWLLDLALDQAPDGTVPLVVPDILGRGQGVPAPVAAWGDAAVIVPWVVAERFGDPAVLERQWPSMRAWVERLLAARDDDGLWSAGMQLGDWLDPTAPPDSPADAQADPYLVASAYLVRSLSLLADAARSLGFDEDRERYADLAARTRRAFQDMYVTRLGRVVSDCPTAYALALAFDLVTHDVQRGRAGQRLADLVRLAGYRISTGFVGTPLIADALTSAGHIAVAYRLLLQRRCPSWLYPVTMGATTVWERWDSMLPDGSINPGEMTSFNHYALGAVADWLHRRVAGLAPAAPGYRHIEVRPQPGGGLTRAAAVHQSPYGEIRVAWAIRDDAWHVELTVPPGTTARVVPPTGDESFEVGSGHHSWSTPWRNADRDAVRPDEHATLRAVMDHEPTWDHVASALVAHGMADDDIGAGRALAGFFDRPFSEVLAFLGDFLPLTDPAGLVVDVRQVLQDDTMPSR